MRHFLKVVLVFLIIVPNLSAKDTFKEGYVISLKGDTTKGLLLVQNSKKASVQCVFKAGDNEVAITYYPKDISGYRYVDGKFYISKEINANTTESKVVFLEFLIKGMANIYYYVDNDWEHYYIEKEPEGFTELTEEEVTFHTNTGQYNKPKVYKGKLRSLLQDCPEINSKIESTVLTHKSLIKLSKEYHENVCDSESCIVFEKENTSPKIKFGVTAGLSNNRYNFGNQVISSYEKNFQIGATLKASNIFMFSEKLNLKAGIFLEKDLQPYTLSLTGDVHFLTVTNGEDVVYLRDLPSSYNYNPTMEVDLKVVDLKIPIILNYDFGIAKNTIFSCGFGLSNKFILSQNMDFKIEDFYAAYGKSINSLLTGPIVAAGIEGNWFGGHAVFVSMVYEHLVDFRSHVDNSLRMYNDQISVQAGVYF